jgi:two-component system sensor histidine kinase YesM
MIKIIKPKFIEQIKQHLMVLIGLFTPFGNKEKQAEPLQVSTVHFSIRTKILLALGLVIVTIGATNAIFVGKILDYSRKYDAIITNITTANSISGNIKRDIDTEMWQIVAGKNSFEQGKQYQIIEDVNQKILRMQANTDSHRARIKLEIIRRSIQTLKEHIDKMGERIKQKSTAAENEAALEKIRLLLLL